MGCGWLTRSLSVQPAFALLPSLSDIVVGVVWLVGLGCVKMVLCWGDVVAKWWCEDGQGWFEVGGRAVLYGAWTVGSGRAALTLTLRKDEVKVKMTKCGKLHTG